MSIKILKPALALLQEIGMHAIDSMAKSKLLIYQVNGMCYHIKSLEFLINKRKFILEPSSGTDFLGVMVNTKETWVFG